MALKNARYLGNQVPVAGMAIDAVAGESDHLIPDWDVSKDPNLNNLSRFIYACRVLFDGTTPPNSLTVTIKDGIGVTIATGTLTASGEIDLGGSPIPTAGGLTVSFSGNTTNSAKFTMEILFV